MSDAANIVGSGWAARVWPPGWLPSGCACSSSNRRRLADCPVARDAPAMLRPRPFPDPRKPGSRPRAHRSTPATMPASAAFPSSTGAVMLRYRERFFFPHPPYRRHHPRVWRSVHGPSPHGRTGPGRCYQVRGRMRGSTREPRARPRPIFRARPDEPCRRRPWIGRFCDALACTVRPCRWRSISTAGWRAQRHRGTPFPTPRRQARRRNRPRSSLALTYPNVRLRTGVTVQRIEAEGDTITGLLTSAGPLRRAADRAGPRVPCTRPRCCSAPPMTRTRPALPTAPTRSAATS